MQHFYPILFFSLCACMLASCTKQEQPLIYPTSYLSQSYEARANGYITVYGDNLKDNIKAFVEGNQLEVAFFMDSMQLQLSGVEKSGPIQVFLDRPVGEDIEEKSYVFIRQDKAVDKYRRPEGQRGFRFVNKQVYYQIYENEIRRTENDGESYEIYSLPISYSNLRMFCAPNPKTILIEGSLNNAKAFFVSIDKGRSWKPISFGMGILEYVKRVVMDTDGVGYAIVDGKINGNYDLAMFKTSDYGMNWELITIFSTIKYLNEGAGAIVKRGAYIYVFDNANTYKIKENGEVMEFIRTYDIKGMSNFDVTFDTQGAPYFFNRNNEIVKWEDNRAPYSLFEVPLHFSDRLEAIHLNSKGEWIVFSERGGIGISKDKGETWDIHYQKGTFHRVEIPNNSEDFAFIGQDASRNSDFDYYLTEYDLENIR